MGDTVLERILYKVCALLLLIIASISVQSLIWEREQVSGITMEDWEGEEFRMQLCSEEFLEQLDRYFVDGNTQALTVSMLMQQYRPKGLMSDDSMLIKYKNDEYQRMLAAYGAIWGDLKVFPVASQEVFYEDTWLAPREYDSPRLHEGCDIFGKEDISGYYPIVSMTDGTVEKIGWLPLGGYRIGIRSPQGGYFYYAHLDSYDREFQEGDAVTAGEILGYMGDSGYGTQGTTGKFPVHLHLGIYIQTTNYEELSVNPYWILRYIHKNIVKYAY